MSAIQDLAHLAQRFDADRPHLRSVAFHLLGSVADADDAVQSAWLKASRSDRETLNALENLTAWFTTITATRPLDQLRVRNRRAERPLVESDELDRLAVSAPADQDALLADSVNRALLVVLDRLSPEQRVAFVLHDVFAVPFETIADLLDRSPAAAKKLASRARGRVRADPGTQPRRAAKHLQIVQAFLAASRGGDIGALLSLLAPNVVRRVDRALVPEDVPAELRGASGRRRGNPTIHPPSAGRCHIAHRRCPGHRPRAGRARQSLLQIGFGDDNRIHTIDITGDSVRLRCLIHPLPPDGLQTYHMPIGYQGEHDAR